MGMLPGVSWSGLEDEFKVIDGKLPNGVEPSLMVENQLRKRTVARYHEWAENFMKLQENGGWNEQIEVWRSAILDSIGPFPERTPLNAQVTGVIDRPRYRVEKVLFESRPGFYVTGSLYLPKAQFFDAPYAGVLIPCGHAVEAKAHDEYQAMGALVASHGMVGFVFDPIDQSERMQYRSNDADYPYYGTHMHMQESIISTLLGQGLIQNFVWDGMRALDYLESRPEVDPERLGVTGNSGGGTQTSHIFALDERLKVAVPSCWPHLTSRQVWDSLGDGEQQFFGMLEIGIEHPALYLMRAPAPVKILAATHDFFLIDAVWEGFRYIKRRYTDLGYSERADILENNAGHNYNRTQREAAARWLHFWLNGEMVEIWEADHALFTEEELWATPSGQVLEIEGARSIFDFFMDDYEMGLARRKANWARRSPVDRRSAVRELVGSRPAREIPAPMVHFQSSVDLGPLQLHKALLEYDEGIFLPVVDLRPKSDVVDRPLLVLDPVGAYKALSRGSTWFQAAEGGRRVVGVDLRDMGETLQDRQILQGAFFSSNQYNYYAHYLLQENFIAKRIDDVLLAIRYIEETEGANFRGVDLFAVGEAGPIALHAAFLEPDLIHSTRLRRSLKSWYNILENRRSYRQLNNTVYGALGVYDLPVLVEELGANVQVEMPVNSLGFVQRAVGEPFPPGYEDPTRPGLIGIHYGSPRYRNPQGEFPLDTLSFEYDNEIMKMGNDLGLIWNGYLIGPADGEIQFQGRADHGLMLIVDNQTLLKADDFPGTQSATLTMVEGEPYPIEVRFPIPDGGQGAFDLRWSWEGGDPVTVKGNYLRHSLAGEEASRRRLR